MDAVPSTQVGPHDVLCGRGAGANNHAGNRLFRQLVSQSQESYCIAGAIRKARIASGIVENIRGRDPPGRFLKRLNETEGSAWYVDIGDGAAREKTSQALREKGPEIKRALAGAKSAREQTEKGRTVFATRDPETKTFGLTLVERIDTDPDAAAAGLAATSTSVRVGNPGKSSAAAVPRAGAEGLVEGDAIVAVNYVPARGWSLKRVAGAILKTDGDLLTLEVRSPPPPANAVEKGGGGGEVGEVVAAAMIAAGLDPQQQQRTMMQQQQQQELQQQQQQQQMVMMAVATQEQQLKYHHQQQQAAMMMAAAAKQQQQQQWPRQQAAMLWMQQQQKQQPLLAEQAAQQMKAGMLGPSPKAPAAAAAPATAGARRSLAAAPVILTPLGTALVGARASTGDAQLSVPSAARGKAAPSTSVPLVAPSPATGRLRAKKKEATREAASPAKKNVTRKAASPAKKKVMRKAASPGGTTPQRKQQGQEQQRDGEIIQRGSEIILGEYDETHVPIAAHDVKASDPAWYGSYRDLVELRNSSVLGLHSPGEWLEPNAILDDTLRVWVDGQRTAYGKRRSALRRTTRRTESADEVAIRSPTLAKIELLNGMNFVWLPRGCSASVLGPIEDTEWRSYHDRLFDHVSGRGHGIVPNYTELGMWCGVQRLKRRGGTLDWRKVQALNALGFDWDGDEAADWSGMRAKLARFEAKHGDCLVMPPPDVDEPDDKVQRNMDDGGGNKVADSNEGEKEGEKRGEEEENVHNKEKQDGEDCSKLWWWVQAQRIEWKRPRDDSYLTPAHIGSLNELDFIWSPDHMLNAKWIRDYHNLKVYAAEHGTFHIPASNKGKIPQQLKRFIHNMRGRCETMKRREKKERQREEEEKNMKLPIKDWRDYGSRNCTLTPMAIRFLDSIGFAWVPENARGVATAWEDKFEELRQYKERTGSCHVHQSDKSLGNWVKIQRKMYDHYHREGKYSSMTEERIQKLEELGFLWRVRGRRGKGLQREEALKEARETWKAARNKRRSLDLRAGAGAGASEGTDRDSDSGENGHESSTDGKNTRVTVGKKRKLTPSQDVSDCQSSDDAMRGIIHTLKCRVCSNIIVNSTACFPCGHSFCASCIKVWSTCPNCKELVSAMVPQRDMDKIVSLLVQKGGFDDEDADMYRRRLVDTVGRMF